MKDLMNLIRTIPDFPKKGILFRDITTLLKNSEGFKEAIEILKKECILNGLNSLNLANRGWKRSEK